MRLAPAFVDKRGAAEYTGLSVRSIDYARSSGDLCFIRHGRKVLFKVDDLDAYMIRFRVDVTEVEGGK